MDKYRILHALNPQTLESRVRMLKEQGYRCAGGISVAFDGKETLWVQAMELP
jgi:hypothetical protein